MPPDPVPVHCALPAGFEQDAVYVVGCEGETGTLPDTAPPVEKLVPVHEVAFVELHESVEVWPWLIDDGATESAQVGSVGVQVNDPLVAPLHPPDALAECTHQLYAVFGVTGKFDTDVEYHASGFG